MSRRRTTHTQSCDCEEDLSGDSFIGITLAPGGGLCAMHGLPASFAVLRIGQAAPLSSAEFSFCIDWVALVVHREHR